MEKLNFSFEWTIMLYEDARLTLSYFLQKQPPRGVFRKRCSENMQQIYLITPMCDFNKVALQLYWIFGTPFPKSTSDGLFLFFIISLLLLRHFYGEFDIWWLRFLILFVVIQFHQFMVIAWLELEEHISCKALKRFSMFPPEISMNYAGKITNLIRYVFL